MIQFNKKRGLCGNIICMYSGTTELNVIKEMRTQFMEVGLEVAHPFGETDYWQRNQTSSMYLCPKRRAWTRGHYQYPPHDQSKELTEFYGAWYEWAVAQSN